VIGSKYKPLVIAWSTRKFSAWRVYSPSQHVIRLFFLNDSCRIGVSRNVALTSYDAGCAPLASCLIKTPLKVISLWGSYAWSTVGSGPRSRCAGPQHCRNWCALICHSHLTSFLALWPRGLRMMNYLFGRYFTELDFLQSSSRSIQWLIMTNEVDSQHSRFLGQLITIRCYTEQFQTLEKI